MLKIPYLAPERSASEEQRAAALVDQMSALVARMKRYANDPDNKFKLILASQRRLLTREGFEPVLVNNIAFFTEQVRRRAERGFQDELVAMVGFTSSAFPSELYASDAVRRALQESHKGRCAYCESLIDNSAYGDVEHFRPKVGYTTPSSSALFRPGYHMLAYDPTNLLLSCQLCNQAYKGNAFPVFGERVPAVRPDQELALLIDPYRDDPRDFIRFNPRNGAAYPFDQVAAFYRADSSWSPQQTATELWKDPAKIPLQTTYAGQPLSNPQVDARYQDWLKTQSNPLLTRGSRTIATLELNRRPLVRARLAHLRHVRGLVWTANTGTGQDQSAAAAFVQSLTGTPAPALVPQYVSLSIDAAETWQASTAAPESWIAAYDAALQAFVPKSDLVVAPPRNDALAYIVLSRDVKLAGRRRMIYITHADKVYGNPTGERAVVLAIDWDKDLLNTVLLYQQRRLVKQTTLYDLIHDHSQLWTIFKAYDVWAIGNYSPYRS
jgi:uncharacterized protein (TIGR02646 family)